MTDDLSFDEILAREARTMGVPCREINGWENRGFGHHVRVLLYEHESDVLGPQLRLAICIDGRIVAGAIVGDKGRSE